MPRRSALASSVAQAAAVELLLLDPVPTSNESRSASSSFTASTAHRHWSSRLLKKSLPVCRGVIPWQWETGATMRGDDEICGSLFSYIDLEARVRADHPLRSIREIANVALASLSADFTALYSGTGRPSVPPEKLLRAMLLQAFYSVRSERQLMERIEFDLLFRWFVGIGIDDPV